MNAKKIFLLTAGILLAAALCGQAFPGHEWPYGPLPEPKLAPAPQTAVGQSAVAAGGDASIFVGYRYSGSSINGVIWKTNSWGKVLWRTEIAGSGDDYLQHVERTPDGNFIAAGYTSSPEWTTGIIDMLLVKFNGRGKILWRKTFGYSGQMSYAFSCGIGPQGGYFAFGTHQAGPSKFMLLLVDQYGRENWRQSYDIGLSEFGATAMATRDGGFLLFGEAMGETGSSDLLLVKTDGQGEYLSHRYYGDSGTQWAFLSAPPTGNSLIEVAATEEYPAGYIFCGLDISSLEAIVCRVDGSDLSEVWYNEYISDTPGAPHSPYAVRHMGSNVLVAGSTFVSGIETGQTWMLGASGNQLWAHTSQLPGGVSDPLYFLLPLFDQTFLAGGRVSNISGTHFYLTRCRRADGSEKWERFID